MAEGRLAGRVAIVTGSGEGIGRSIAQRFAEEGANILVAELNPDLGEAAAAELGAITEARFVRTDVGSKADNLAMVAAAVDAWGRLDILVNNAWGGGELSRVENKSDELIDHGLAIGFRGPLWAMQAAFPIMKAQGSGQIVNLSSIGGHAVSPTAAVYCATKFAVRAISDGLRQETDKIRVTVISPGTTASELADTISDPASRELMKEWRSITISAEAVANSILYAVSQPEDVDVSEIVIRPTASPH